MNREKKTPHVLAAALLILVMTVIFASAAMAEEGWVTKGKKTYFYVQSDAGPVKAVGLQKIGSKYFYFNEKGVLQTGWVLTADGYRYFYMQGKNGVKGKMYTGLKNIKGKIYYFDPATGVLQTGLTELKQGTYYFKMKGKAGVMGRAYTSKWATVNGKRYYFDAKGKMAKSKWIKGYYVGADGVKLVNTVTPDGYKVNKNGKKVSKKKVDGWVKLSGKWYFFKVKTGFYKSRFVTLKDNTYYLSKEGPRVYGWQDIDGYRYYFDTSTGVMQTGLTGISGKDYYFDADGRLQISKTVDGYVTDSTGAIVDTSYASGNGKARILVVAGHGQGDSGAVSSLGQEYLKTREFASLVVAQLKNNGKVDVEYYKNGSTSYDLYQQHVKSLGSSGANISSKITGSGSYKNKVLTACKKNANLPVLTNYDYVLEIHFNATAASSKDLKGNGTQKGFSYYVNSKKTKRKVETSTISKIKNLGFAIFGSGIHSSSTLFNARICQELGVNYALAETAFIDDKDDMKFYNSHKLDMAKALAAAIEEYYGS